MPEEVRYFLRHVHEAEDYTKRTVTELDGFATAARQSPSLRRSPMWQAQVRDVLNRMRLAAQEGAAETDVPIEVAGLEEVMVKIYQATKVYTQAAEAALTKGGTSRQAEARARQKELGVLWGQADALIRAAEDRYPEG